MARGRGRGGGGGGRGGRGGRGRGGARGGAQSGRGGEYNDSPVKMDNKVFESYYLGQQILPAEEWTAFLDAMRAPLPTTFRITPGKHTTPMVQDEMRNVFLPALTGVQHEGEPVPPPTALDWYPHGLGWQIDVKKSVLRKEAQFKKFQQWLVHETLTGSISRQEAVSMIPPLFLDVKPHHIVMDMCAAPGSKTAQLIEALHSPTSSAFDSFDPMPPGVIVANDSDNKRAHMLVHQSARLPSPNIIVTNCDATMWPRVEVPWRAKDSEQTVSRPLRFDRVLADVPCSGDGTMRKNITIWREWRAGNGMSLHALQLRILLKGLSVLRPGGRLVYSTCSLNPIENEAVVSAALREHGADPANGVAGKVRVVDVSEQYPMLKRCKGLTHWRVSPGSGRHLMKEEAKKDEDAAATTADAEAADGAAEAGEPSEAAAPAAAAPAPGTAEYLAELPTTRWVESYEALQAVDKSLASRTPRTAWPCGQEKAMGLEHAMRVYPHHQNTGGFFVCVLELEGERDEEGQAAGMIRAMEAKDRKVEAEAGPSAPAASAEASTEEKVEASSSAAASSSIKRALSPSADADAPEGKRLREDEPQEDAAEADEVAADPNASIKPDNHAAARAQRGKKNGKDEGFGLPGGMPWKEDPFTYVDWQNAQTQSVLKFFGAKPEFPKHNFLVRNIEGEPLRTVYMTSTAVRAIVNSGGPGANGHPSMNPRRMRMLNCGVKTLARQEAGKDTQLECRWRAIADGAPVIRPFVRDEMLGRAELSDLAFLLSNHYPTLESTPDTPFFREMRSRKMGSYFADFVPGEHEGTTLSTTLNYPVWRAVASINLMLDKQEKSALSCRIFGRDLSSEDGERVFIAHPNQRAAMRQKAEQAALEQRKADELEQMQMEAAEAAGGASSAPAAAEPAPEAAATAVKTETAEEGQAAAPEAAEQTAAVEAIKTEVKEEGQAVPLEQGDA